jgi:tetratricopeptide (TPR) repeat protein
MFVSLLILALAHASDADAPPVGISFGGDSGEEKPLVAPPQDSRGNVRLAVPSGPAPDELPRKGTSKRFHPRYVPQEPAMPAIPESPGEPGEPGMPSAPGAEGGEPGSVAPAPLMSSDEEAPIAPPSSPPSSGSEPSTDVPSIEAPKVETTVTVPTTKMKERPPVADREAVIQAVIGGGAATKEPSKLKPGEIEMLQTRAIVLYNRGRHGDALKLFHRVLHEDPKSFLPIEYLGKIAEAHRDYLEAIRIYKHALRIAPPERLGALHFAIGDLYVKTGREGLSEAYFESALELGAFPVHSNYYLGYALYRQQQWRDAEEYLRQAEVRSEASKEKVDPQLLQAMHFYLGEMYVRLGYPRYSLAELYLASDGANVEVKRAAWALEEALDQPSRRLSVGVLSQYDSNVLSVPNTTTQQPQSSSGVVGLVNLSLQTSPSRRWGYGGEYGGYLTRHSAQELANGDLLTNGVSVFGSWWNQRNMEARVKFEYLHTMIDRDALKLYEQSTGPTVSWSYFWDRRRQIDLSYSYKRNYFPGDAAVFNSGNELSGEEHIWVAKTSFNAPNPDLQPYLQFTEDWNQASGTSFYGNTHTLEAGTAYQAGTIARFTLSASLGYASYPRSVVERHDFIRAGRLVATAPLSSYLLAIIDCGYTDRWSSEPDLFSTRRLLASGGIIYTIPF